MSTGADDGRSRARGRVGDEPACSVWRAGEPDLGLSRDPRRAAVADDDLGDLPGEDARGGLLRGTIDPDRNPTRGNLQLAPGLDTEDLREAGAGVDQVEAIGGSQRTVGEPTGRRRRDAVLALDLHPDPILHLPAFGALGAEPPQGAGEVLPRLGALRNVDGQAVLGVVEAASLGKGGVPHAHASQAAGFGGALVP